jgi:hypothetical protein
MGTARRDDSRYPTVCFVAGLLNNNKEVRLYKISVSCLTNFTFCRIISISVRDSKFQQDRQCAYNVTSKHVRATVVAVEKQKYYVFRLCVCSLGYPAYKVHARYYIVICDLPGSAIFFSHCLVKGTIFEKNMLLDTKCVVVFSETFVRNPSHSTKN